jgi:four helix bundle protein
LKGQTVETSAPHGAFRLTRLAYLFQSRQIQHVNSSYQGQPKPAKPFQTLEDLEVYQLAREFRKVMYAVSRGLPDFEKFELASQIRRASVSLTNNIAEGHGRYHFLDQLKFLLQARGSLEELIDDLNVCFDEKYLPHAEIELHKQLGWRVHQVINGYGRYLRQRKASETAGLKESPSANLTNDDVDPFADLPF